MAVMKKTKKRRKEHIKVGPRAQKTLLLLQTGITLSLTARPDVFFKIIKDTSKKLKEIDDRVLRRTIASLYRSKLVGYLENRDGTITITLTEEGKHRALRYNPNVMTIEKQKNWDGLWRVVMFDIPEKMREGRTVLVQKLKQLGFYPLQKSVFILPYDCKNEVDFLIEAFDLRKYTRFLLVKETDLDIALKHKFTLS